MPIVDSLPPGTQDMVQGVVVILVLALAGREAMVRRSRSVSTVDAGQNASSAAPVTATER